MTRLSNGGTAYIPRLLGIYPTITSTSQLTEFTDTWKKYGSEKQLQVIYSVGTAKRYRSHGQDKYLEPNAIHVCMYMQFSHIFSTVKLKSYE